MRPTQQPTKKPSKKRVNTPKEPVSSVNEEISIESAKGGKKGKYIAFSCVFIILCVVIWGSRNADLLKWFFGE